ncbi:hypothetical protein ABKN59_010980 [Abortiporus biennis]
MGHTKRKSVRPAPQVRSRTTRSKGRPLADPASNTQLLTDQLRALGLYAAPTLGDGNCLFRALSDQVYGTPTHHLKLRQDICNWIEAHKSRYEPFVEDERGIEVHLQCMRQQATYGGHMELSAFAHMTKHNVKVIQPGLVYVIEWNAGGDTSGDAVTEAPVQPVEPEEGPMNHREKRRAKREQQKEPTATPSGSAPSEDSALGGTVYVAYHDWEHFSSIRNLRGPHSGLPNVQESPVPEDRSSAAPASKASKHSSRAGSKPASKATASKHKDSKPSSSSKRGTSSRAATVEPAAEPSTPCQVPLPSSRSPSPSSILSQTPVYPIPAAVTPSSPDSLRAYRSPKRTFDESSASSDASHASAAKRAKKSARPPFSQSSQTPGDGEDADEDEEDDEDYNDTPPLSLSPASVASSSPLSSLSSSPASTPPPPDPEPLTLTKRERKKLGLPKSKSVLTGKRASAGRIVIAGGKYNGPKRLKVVQPASKVHDGEDDGANEEWQRNGTGRFDVRGFRELKI